MRLAIVRRRIGTPPTGSSVFGVSSENGRSRVAQPAARMTAFIERSHVCKSHARRAFAHLSRLGVELLTGLPPECLANDQFLSPTRHRGCANPSLAKVAIAIVELGA